MDDDLLIIESFKTWLAENLGSAVGHRRTSLKHFNKLVEKSYAHMQSLNNKSDKMSYMCGIAAGMKLMLLPENTDNHAQGE